MASTSTIPAAPHSAPSTHKVALELHWMAADRWDDDDPARRLESAWWRRKALAVEDCGRYAIARVHRTEDRADAVPARCRVRGCPRCDALRSREVQAQQRRCAAAMVQAGYQLRAITLTAPGDPSHTLRERLDLFRAAIRRLLRSASWRSVAGASVYFEAPRNPWHPDREARRRGLRADIRHHWHVHVHVLAWVPRGATPPPPCNVLGELAGGGVHPIAAAWSAAWGWEWRPDHPDRRHRRPLRVHVQEPYAPPGLAGAAAVAAAVEAATVYAIKYASKGTAAASLLRRRERLAWIWQAQNCRFLEHYGCAKQAWAEAAAPESEWQMAATLAECDDAATLCGPIVAALEQAEEDAAESADYLARAEAVAANNPAPEAHDHRQRAWLIHLHTTDRRDDLRRRLEHVGRLAVVGYLARRLDLPPELAPLIPRALADTRARPIRCWAELARTRAYCKPGQGEWLDSLRAAP